MDDISIGHYHNARSNDNQIINDNMSLINKTPTATTRTRARSQSLSTEPTTTTTTSTCNSTRTTAASTIGIGRMIHGRVGVGGLLSSGGSGNSGGGGGGGNNSMNNNKDRIITIRILEANTGICYPIRLSYSELTVKTMQHHLEKKCSPIADQILLLGPPYKVPKDSTIRSIHVLHSLHLGDLEDDFDLLKNAKNGGGGDNNSGSSSCSLGSSNKNTKIENDEVDNNISGRLLFPTDDDSSTNNNNSSITTTATTTTTRHHDEQQQHIDDHHHRRRRSHPLLSTTDQRSGAKRLFLFSRKSFSEPISQEDDLSHENQQQHSQQQQQHSQQQQQQQYQQPSYILPHSDSIQLPTIPDPSPLSNLSSSDHHTLLSPTSPLHQALSVYERQFMLHLNQAQLLSSKSKLRYEGCQQCISECAAMARALRAAVANLSDHFNSASRVRSELSHEYSKHYQKNFSLLGNGFESTLQKLEQITLHSVLRKKARGTGRGLMDTLLDTVPLERERKWMERCEDGCARLSLLFEELDGAFSNLGYEQVDVQVQQQQQPVQQQQQQVQQQQQQQQQHQQSSNVGSYESPSSPSSPSSHSSHSNLNTNNTTSSPSSPSSSSVIDNTIPTTNNTNSNNTVTTTTTTNIMNSGGSKGDVIAEEEVEELWNIVEGTVADIRDAQAERLKILRNDHNKAIRVILGAIGKSSTTHEDTDTDNNNTNNHHHHEDKQIINKNNDNDNNNSSSSGDATQAAFSILERMSKSSVSIIPSMSKDDQKLLQIMSRLSTTKINLSKRMKQRLREISIAQSSIQRVLSSTTILREALHRQSDECSHLEHVVELPSSYRLFIQEIRRRRFYITETKSIIEQAWNRMNRMRQLEIVERDAFLKGPGRHLMPCFLSCFAPTLATLPPSVAVMPITPPMAEMDMLPDFGLDDDHHDTNDHHDSKGNNNNNSIGEGGHDDGKLIAVNENMDVGNNNNGGGNFNNSVQGVENAAKEVKNISNTKAATTTSNMVTTTTAGSGSDIGSGNNTPLLTSTVVSCPSASSSLTESLAVTDPNHVEIMGVVGGDNNRNNDQQEEHRRSQHLQQQQRQQPHKQNDDLCIERSDDNNCLSQDGHETGSASVTVSVGGSVDVNDTKKRNDSLSLMITKMKKLEYENDKLRLALEGIKDDGKKPNNTITSVALLSSVKEDSSKTIVDKVDMGGAVVMRLQEELSSTKRKLSRRSSELKELRRQHKQQQSLPVVNDDDKNKTTLKDADNDKDILALALSSSSLSVKSQICDKISHSNFVVGDVGLFMPTGRKSKEGQRTYLAFHSNCPHRYLSTDGIIGCPDYVLGRIIYQEELVASGSSGTVKNPHGLHKGTRFWVLTVEVIKGA